MRQLTGDPAVGEHDDPVGHADHLGKFRGDHQDRHALSGQLPHEGVDTFFRADVDAAGGLVQNNHLRLGRQPFRQHHLLLVASGEETHLLVIAACDQIQRGEDAGDVPRSLGGLTRGHRVQHQSGVRYHGLVQCQPLSLAVFGDQGEPCTHSSSRRGDPHRPAVAQPDLAAREPFDAEQRVRHLGAATALKAGQRGDLSSPQLEVDAIELIIAAAGHPQPDVPGYRPGKLVGIEARDRPAHHLADQLVGGDRGRVHCVDQGSVLEDRHPVGEVEDLLEPVGDVEDRHAALPQPLDQAVQELDLLVGERGGRLVHRDDPGVMRDRLDDLHDLLSSDGQRPHRAPRHQPVQAQVPQ